MDTDAAWQLWGVRDPYFGVLTDPRFRSATITAADKQAFFDSGREHVDQVLKNIRQLGDPTFSPRRVLDFGCGVGRLVVPLARVASEVVGMDIAPSMLDEARMNCAAHEVTNATLVLSDDALSAADGRFDLVHSSIVLQHIEVRRGTKLFAELVGRVAPGGAGAIHVTLGWTLHAATWGQLPPLPPPPPPATLAQTMRRWLRPSWTRSTPAAPPIDPPSSEDPEMQMNYYNLSELMFILHAAGVDRIHCEMTDHGGAVGAFLFFRLPG